LQRKFLPATSENDSSFSDASSELTRIEHVAHQNFLRMPGLLDVALS
jgi:hypothetical protein